MFGTMSCKGSTTLAAILAQIPLIWRAICGRDRRSGDAQEAVKEKCEIAAVRLQLHFSLVGPCHRLAFLFLNMKGATSEHEVLERRDGEDILH
jgi:hypothetical protein